MKNIFLIIVMLFTISCKKSSNIEPEYIFTNTIVNSFGNGYVQDESGIVYKFDGKEFQPVNGSFSENLTFVYEEKVCFVSNTEFNINGAGYNVPLQFKEGEIFYSNGYIFHNWVRIASNPTLTGIYLDVYKIDRGLKLVSSFKLDKYVFGVTYLNDVPVVLFKTRQYAKYFPEEIIYSKLDVNFAQVKQYVSDNNSIYFLMQSGAIVKVHNSDYSTVSNKSDAIFSYENNVYSIVDGKVYPL